MKIKNILILMQCMTVTLCIAIPTPIEMTLKAINESLSTGNSSVALIDPYKEILNSALEFPDKAAVKKYFANNSLIVDKLVDEIYKMHFLALTMYKDLAIFEDFVDSVTNTIGSFLGKELDPKKVNRYGFLIRALKGWPYREYIPKDLYEAFNDENGFDLVLYQQQPTTLFSLIQQNFNYRLDNSTKTDICKIFDKLLRNTQQIISSLGSAQKIKLGDYQAWHKARCKDSALSQKFKDLKR